MVRISIMVTASRGGFAQLAAALRLLMAQARAVEGCVNGHVSNDLHNLYTLHYVEEWMSEGEFQHDIRSARFGRLIESLELAASPPLVHIQVIAESHGLDYIEAARRELP